MLSTRLWLSVCTGLFRSSYIKHFDFHNNSNNTFEQIYQLRQRVREMEEQHIEGNMLIDARSNLIILLARSIRKEDREEGLALGEAMWQRLISKNSPIPASSRTTMSMVLCTTMRRCALKNKDEECAEKWTKRFAQRTAFLCFDDFDGSTEEEERMSSETDATNSKTGNDDGSEGEEDVAKRNKLRARKRTPLEQYRRQIQLDHPLMQRALNLPEQPGPRYTD